MKILILDTYYPAFVETLPDPAGDYATELHRVLGRCFGTFDAYSFYLTAEGHECADVIANHTRLQRRWAMEYRGWNSGSDKAIVLEQIAAFNPDVLFLQDVSYFNAAELVHLGSKHFLAAQISCPMPRVDNIRQLKCVFTSFPHYVDRIKAMGVPTVEYLPLAFDPRMLSEESPVKQYDISFVGGVGKNSHWKAGTEMLERVAAEFKERFVWFGYGRENLEAGSPLHACYRGEAWGRDMYRVYGRSKCVVNRHGEIAEGYANNLRIYEAIGMGAMLFNDGGNNLSALFPDPNASPIGYPISKPENLIRILKDWLKPSADCSSRPFFAEQTQQYVLNHHTYAHRMKVVSDVLTAAVEKVTA